MRRIARLVMQAAIFAAAVSPLAAQTVRGRVVLPDSVTPVAGVIVVARDPRGANEIRALSGQRGEFTLPVPSPGTYSLTLLRIGYRPMPGPSIDVAVVGADTLRIIYQAQPVVLTTVDVRERQTCRVSADTGSMVARLWDEARKAMLTTKLSSDANPLVAEWIDYDRTFDATERTVRQQRVRTSRNQTTHVFASIPATTLAAVGYVQFDSSGTTYFAPDADVLLSDSFASNHCFHIVSRASGADDLIGVGFVPARERRGIVDIQGTLWIDRRSAELRTLEFRYTNQSGAAARANPGGSVEFLRLGDGQWLVSRWNVRMPQLVVYTRPQTVFSPTTQTLRAIQVVGGEVVRIFRRDSVIFQHAGSEVNVQVVARDSSVSVVGARLTLDGTDYNARADSSGKIRISPVLTGRYQATVTTPMMDALGAKPATHQIETRTVDERSTQLAHVDSLMLPTSREIVTMVCSKDSARDGEGMLYGRVRNEGAGPVGQAAVVVTWKTDFTAIGTASGGTLGYSERTLGTLTDADGSWRICGVPRDLPLSVRTVSDAGADMKKVRLENYALASVDLVARRGSGTTLSDPTPPAGGRALVELAALDIRGSPLPGTSLELRSRDGLKRTVVTGSGGRALVPDVTPGILEVQAKQSGLKSGHVAASVEAGRNTVPIILNEKAMPTLDTIRVVGDHRVVGPRRLDEFETRRLNRQATVSITRDDIVRRNPTEAWQMLVGIPSVHVADIDTMVVARSTRTQRSNSADDVCYLMVAVDGVAIKSDPLHTAVDLRQLPRPDEIYGVEVFAGPASIPPRFAGVGDGKSCGLIAIWTR